jgi:hypothetical protein
MNLTKIDYFHTKLETFMDTFNPMKLFLNVKTKALKINIKYNKITLYLYCKIYDINPHSTF